MSEIQIKDLKNKIIKSVSAVPGLVGLNLDESDSNHNNEGIQILETSRGYQIQIFIISSINVRAEIVSKEVSSSIKNLASKNNIQIENINIFIREVK
ncbi:MAG: hypothetical protein GY679_02820 [Mycoplasma sp.]|nr:hypothetical protein [Mycoplasma sp.]